MQSFLQWNDAIASHFFRLDQAGKTVYLYVTPQVIERIGGTGSLPAFVEAVKSGPPWATTRAGLCQRALQSMEDWRAKGLEYPPYVGYLSLFVLAAGHEGDFGPHAYYPRLRSLLNEPAAAGMYPSFQRMYELWGDLEKWLNIDNRGELGILRTDVAGAMFHVGLPIAQEILTEAEIQHLHSIFDEAGLEPDLPPSDLELARIVHSQARGSLRSRTIRALEAVQTEYGEVLVDRILEELESWDGTAPANGNENGLAVRNGTGILCLTSIDEIARKIKMELRCRFPSPFPDPIIITHDDTLFMSSEAADGYSTPFWDGSEHKLNPTVLDWTKGAIFKGRDTDLTIRWPAAVIRVFAEGKSRGFAGYFEVQFLDPSRPFIVAVESSKTSAVRRWGDTSCRRFRAIITAGGPVGWEFFAADSASDDSLIRDLAPRLSFSKKLRRIRLVGGIKVPESQSYFRFAPPSIHLEGGTENVILIKEMQVNRSYDGTFEIPEELLTENILSIKADSLSRIIYLQDASDQPHWPLRKYEADGSVNGVGTPDELLPCGVPKTVVTNAIGYELPSIPNDVTAKIIGRLPGEVAEYDINKSLSFVPIWVVLQHGRTETAHYVAQELLAPLSQSTASKKAIKEWKEILWYGRKRIKPPAFEPLRLLWLAYQNGAKNV